MVAKRKAKAKPKAKARPRKGRGRRLAFVLLFALLGAGVGEGLYLMNRAPAEIAVPAVVALSVGRQGVGAGTLDSPRGLAVAPNGDLYVADLGHSRIEVFGEDGSFKSAFGIKGAQGGNDKPGEFNEPSGVAVGPDGTVYVADAWNERIQKFNPKGKPIGEYGGAGGPYSFYSPRTVFVDGSGNLYVGDTGNSLVKVIAPNGKLVMTLGGKGSGDGGLSQEVFGVVVNARGEIFVADHGNHRIHKFAASGAWIKDRKVPGWAQSDPFWPQLAVDKQGMIYAGDSGNGKIWIYDSDLNYRGTLGAGQGQSPFAVPLGLAFSPAGDLWVADMGANKLLKLAPFTVPAPK